MDAWLTVLLGLAVALSAMTKAEFCNVLPPVPSLRKIELSVEPVPPPMVPVAVAVKVVPLRLSPDPASR
jgi:hypothetical protein